MALSLRDNPQSTAFLLNGSISEEPRLPHRVVSRMIIALIGASSLFALTYLGDVGLLVLPVLGLLLIVQGIHTHRVTFMIPGGLLLGVGLGILLTAGRWHLTNDDAASIFLLTSACGWCSISILSKLFTRHPQWWAMIPGAMMALTGLFATII